MLSPAARLAALGLAGLASLVAAPRPALAQTSASFTGEARLAREFNLARDWAAQLQLKGDLKHRLDPERSVSVHADAQGVVQQQDGAADATTPGRVNELYASAELGAWQASAGRRIVSWDVAYAFRPNDVVQREVRRSLLPTTPQGRGVVQLEHFGSDEATSLVWVEPERGADGSALALRHYRRLGALDLHAHAHWSRATRTSVGAALAWVATDALEVHASTRWLPRQATSGSSTHQSLIGTSWTGGPDMTVLAEWWHDGTAGPLRRNAYWRASLRHDAWEWALDRLVSLADGGRLTGLGLRWQGDQWRVDAAWRVAGGPPAALYRQLPVRQTGALALTRSF